MTNFLYQLNFLNWYSYYSSLIIDICNFFEIILYLKQRLQIISIVDLLE